MHVLLAQARGEELDITTTTVNILLVFHRELHHQGLVLVAEGVKAGRQGVETGILARLEA